MTVVLLITALVILTFGADALVRGSLGVSYRLKLSPLFIGLTVVGFGTSAPELATGVVAAVRGHDDINVGNVVGSNICNIALILGLAALIMPIPLISRGIRAESIIVVAVAIVPFATIFTGGVTRWMGLFMLAGLILYVVRGYRAGGATGGATEAVAPPVAPIPIGRAVILILAGVTVLALGSHLLVASASAIAARLGLTELAIALTVVAFGTSAPELFTSVVAAARKRSDIAVGNILGSNVFNILGILGLTSIIRPQAVSQQVLVFDGPIMVALSVTCLLVMVFGTRLNRVLGAVLVVVYTAYCAVALFLAPQWGLS